MLDEIASKLCTKKMTDTEKKNYDTEWKNACQKHK